jgi:hypothetical protein
MWDWARPAGGAGVDIRNWVAIVTHPSGLATVVPRSPPDRVQVSEREKRQGLLRGLAWPAVDSTMGET